MDTTKVRNRKEIEADPRGPRSVEEFITAGGVDDIDANAPENDTMANTIEQASVALGEKAEVLKRVQEARELGTLLINMGNGSREQVAWIRFYLPRKKRKDGEVESDANGVGEDEE